MVVQYVQVKDETNPAIEQNQAALADDDNLRQEDPENINDLATASRSGGSDALIDQFSSMKVQLGSMYMQKACEICDNMFVLFVVLGHWSIEAA